MSRLLPGALAAAVLLLVVGGALTALLLAAPTLDPAALWRDVYLRRVVAFTLWQATLSTVLAVGLAVPVARALARRRFAGRGLILKLFGLPLVIPTIVAVFGIVAVYGQNGLFNTLAARLGLPGLTLYGLPGILIAHVFFNLPLAVRLLLPLWDSVPGESWRLAAQLGMRGGALFRLLEWPLLRQALPNVAGLVFMLCFTSFAVVLTLGGGPAATTIEVALYQALRFDFDLGRAVLLALLQLLLCGLLVTLGQALARPLPTETTAARVHERPDLAAPLGRLLDALLIVLATCSVLLPLVMVLYAGLSGPLAGLLDDTVLWAGALRSLAVALAASSLALLLGWALLLSSRELRLRRYRPRMATMLEVGGALVLVAPPLVLGTGFFVLLAPVADVFALGLGLVVLVNALLGLPYVLRVLGPPMQQVARQHDRLCANLGISGWRRLVLVEWPLLRRPVGLALALCAALAVGDLGVITLFGTPDTATLPLLLYQRLGSYRLEQAAVTALVLLGLALLVFVVIERGVGGRHAP